MGTNVKEVQVRTQGNTGAPWPVGSTPLSAPQSASKRDAGGIFGSANSPRAKSSKVAA